MTRQAGQVTTWRLLGGLTALLLSATGLIAGLSALAPPTGHEEVGASEAGPPAPCPAPLRPGSAAVAVSSAQLLECPDSYDGATVRFRGEVVGMVLRRGQRAWLQLNDDTYSRAGPLPEHATPLGPNAGTAVSVPVAVADGIEYVGGHRAAGTRLEVVGTFLRADPTDGGAPAIAALTAEVVDSGRRIADPVHVPQAVAAGVLAALTAVAAGAYGLVRRR